MRWRRRSKMGEKTSVYQTRTCDFFEAQWNRDTAHEPSGYERVRAQLGPRHRAERPREADAVGLHGQRPTYWSRESIFTFEPGLYYPDKGYGMRIEDVYYVHEDGTVENLTDFPRDLVLEV